MDRMPLVHAGVAVCVRGYHSGRFVSIHSWKQLRTSTKHPPASLIRLHPSPQYSQIIIALTVLTTTWSPTSHSCVALSLPLLPNSLHSPAQAVELAVLISTIACGRTSKPSFSGSSLARRRNRRANYGHWVPWRGFSCSRNGIRGVLPSLRQWMAGTHPSYSIPNRMEATCPLHLQSECRVGGERTSCGLLGGTTRCLGCCLGMQ